MRLRWCEAIPQHTTTTTNRRCFRYSNSLSSSNFMCEYVSRVFVDYLCVSREECVSFILPKPLLPWNETQLQDTRAKRTALILVLVMPHSHTQKQRPLYAGRRQPLLSSSKYVRECVFSAKYSPPIYTRSILGYCQAQMQNSDEWTSRPQLSIVPEERQGKHILFINTARRVCRLRRGRFSPVQQQQQQIRSGSIWQFSAKSQTSFPSIKWRDLNSRVHFGLGSPMRPVCFIPRLFVVFLSV